MRPKEAIAIATLAAVGAVGGFASAEWVTSDSNTQTQPKIDICAKQLGTEAVFRSQLPDGCKNFTFDQDIHTGEYYTPSGDAFERTTQPINSDATDELLKVAFTVCFGGIGGVLGWSVPTIVKDVKRLRREKAATAEPITS